MSGQGPTVFSGRYELQRRLGRGGMAEVFLARDQLLDRPVAVKVLAPELARDPSFVERFRREAQAAANLSHPNIVNVYDWGEEHNTYFIVMEYVEGPTLADILRTDGALDPDRAASIASDIAAALSFAHRNGLVHRDIKPGNVLVSPGGQVKVADFGIATVVAGEEAQLTQAGTVMGTATYFSPEQAQGRPVDPRSDLYSLGVVLYEMLVGAPPFSGDNSIAIAYQHVQDQPVAPRQLGVRVAESLEAITLKLLAKNPANRYPSAEDLRSDLRRYREGAHSLGAREAAAAAAAANATQVGPAVAAYNQGAATATMVQQAQPAYVPPAGRGDGPRRTVFAVVALLALLGLLVALVFALGDALGFGGDDDEAEPTTVEVPSLLNDPLEVAQQKLTDLGLTFAVETLPNEAVPENVVFAQDPLAGVKVDAGSVVRLTVSEGEGPLTVPNVVGDPVADAEAELRAAGFEVAITYAENADVEVDDVISQDPTAGTPFERGQVVNLLVSSGPGLIEVPDLRGKTEAEAVAALVRAGFEYETTQEAAEDVDEGKVIRTDPPGLTQLRGGETVMIFISSGRPTARVPAVVGILADTAISELRNRGFVPNPVFQSVPAGSPDNGRVISQNPVADVELELGAAVTIVVGRTADTTTTTTTTAPTTTAPPG
ncbi:MAG: Stk1 family PASTA domain-containing Ser/Thr kinase [Acidimicrobiales bacterium]|jgi:serine/threonine-protein kinase|nr:Stk1 family PASTA domain-containing Ser/Thr kinase [Acidimicrobiales bacterium]